MKKRILSLLLAVITVVGLVPHYAFPAVAQEKAENEVEQTLPTNENNENYITGMVTVSCDGESKVMLEKGDKLYAFTTLDPTLGESVAYVWQLKVNSRSWANVSGYVLPYAVLTEALVHNAKLEDGTARVRCIVETNGQKYVSNELTVTFAEAQDEAEDALEMKSVDPLELLAESAIALDAFQIVVNYTYLHKTAAPNLKLDGQTAANTYTVSLPAGGHYTGTVATPLEVGYLPYVKLDQAQYVTGYDANTPTVTYPKTAITMANGTTVYPETYVAANSIQFTNQSEDIIVNVYYIPQEVTFRVKVYEQNLYNDEYTLAETKTFMRIANEAVGEGYDTPRVGFSALYYDPALSISEDGSFAVDIYYDRNYYLVQYDLDANGEGYGATNHYVRYKTPIVLPTPTRPGYAFVDWTLDLVTNDDKQTLTSHTYAAKPAGGYRISSVEHNLSYSANWDIRTTSYTIIYWLENANDENFTLDSFQVVTGVRPGAVVSATDTLAIEDKSCFTFNAALSDKNVTIAADGTTAINAYYLRNYYTLTFSGSSVCITPEHTHTGEPNMVTCTLEVHTHTAACGQNELTCGKEQHLHDGHCCNLTVHAHTSECCDIPYHVHATSPADDCDKLEHVHHASCYSANNLAEAGSLSGNEKTAYDTLVKKVTGPLNGYVYRVRTSRGGTIYNFLYVHDQWFYIGSGNTYNGVTASGIKNPANSAGSTSSAAATLKHCSQEVHTHGDGKCVCNKTEHDHTSGCNCNIPRHVHGEGSCVCKDGKESHRHVATCYSYKCGKPAHTHNANCVRNCQQIEHTHDSNCDTKTNRNFLKVSRKYDSDISDVWKLVDGQFTNGERWEDDKDVYFKEVLVYIPFMPPANITFKSNTKDGTKEIYHLNYYLETIDGTGFTLLHSVDANYNYLTRAEDFFDIVGFTQKESDPPEFNSSGKYEGTNGDTVSMYYSRNSYDLEFVSLGTTLSSFRRSLKYQQAIDASFEPLAKDVPYPSNMEAGAVRFVGWYTTPNCADGTEFFFDGTTKMPEGGLVLYAKWEDCSYTVNIYSNVQRDELIKTETVLFGSMMIEPDYSGHVHAPTTPGTSPDHPDDGSDGQEKMIFAGWYYKENGEEKRFDFNTMSIKGDMVIYAKWTSRIPVAYVIHYVYYCGTHTSEEDYHDGDGYHKIADSVTGYSLAGLTKTFYAKVDTDLYDGYRTQYFPDMRAHSMTMNSDASKNVYYFTYTIPQEIYYTVKHTFTDPGLESILGTGNNVLTYTISHKIEGEAIATSAASVVVSFRERVNKETIAAAAAAQLQRELTSTEKENLWGVIKGLSPDAYLKDLTLTTGTENEAAFTWENQGVNALYQVIYYIESVDGTEYTIHSIQKALAKVGTVINVKELEINLDIEYYDLNEGEPSKLQGTVVNPGATDELGQGLVLSLYYTRKMYDYTVHYIDNSTGRPLVQQVTTKKARYGTTVKVADEASTFDGYTLINGGDEIIIGAGENKLECKYQGLSVYYQYQVMGIGGTIQDATVVITIGSGAPPAKTLELWNDGFFLYAWYYSVGDGERQTVPKEWLDITGTVVSLPAPTVDMAGKTVYVFAEVLPTTRRFSVEGFASPENDPQAFVFRLQGKVGTSTEGIDMTFIIYDSGHTDISRLPYGEYTLTTLHWAWRFGHPVSVAFNGDVKDATSGEVTLDLNAQGDVIITYPSESNDKWITDAASGHVSMPYVPDP